MCLLACSSCDSSTSFLHPPSSPSCSSGIFPWANRKQQQLVMRPPVPAPPTAFLSTTGDTSLFQMFTSTHTYPTSATHCVLVSSCYKFAYSLQKQTHILSCCLRLSLLDWNYNAEVKCLLTLVWANVQQNASHQTFKHNIWPYVCNLCNELYLKWKEDKIKGSLLPLLHFKVNFCVMINRCLIFNLWLILIWSSHFLNPKFGFYNIKV